uniref:DNA-directed RNA polymerase II subunit RPB9-like zinc ribbon domain-containing protein n=1 Tax=Zea mays TaxID=4577 RepID=A0A804UEQ1_MAIZE
MVKATKLLAFVPTAGSLVLESWSFASYFHRLCFVFRRSNNMLYPREDKETRTLLYACQTCEHEEIATDTCVYKRVIRKPGGEPKDVLKDAATDPSLPRTRSVRCYNCNHPEAAFFQVCTQVLFTCCRCR